MSDQLDPYVIIRILSFLESDQETLLNCLLVNRKFKLLVDPIIDRIKSQEPPHIRVCARDRLLISLQSIKDPNWNRGLYSSCRGGHRDLAQLMIDQGADDWNWGLHAACLGGHRDLAQFMIDQGADDWNRGLEGACEEGHRDLALWMIDQGADDWNRGLNGACLGDHRDLAQLMIDQGADAWDWGLFNACLGGHRDLVRFMIDQGANYCRYCRKSMEDHLGQN